ncbi:MAG TPA: MFS transporter [Gammaproteobacteria bacterium]|nr:MFS transporter [Gammaproteobacteria bacterium]
MADTQTDVGERSRTEEYKGKRHTPRTVVAGTVGNVMEWYDFALYGYFAPVIAQLFFPSDNHIASLIATFGVFAAGFVMRPLGGIVFGFIGDRYGRASVLRISIVTMGTATFLLGALPTHAQAGIWAPILLVGIRLLQGLSVGGEFSGSVTYMVETSPLHRRGFAGSWANFGSLAGTLVGSGFAALITTFLAQSAVAAWGWRLPFLAGGVFGALAYMYVREISSTPHMDHHEGQHEEDSPLHEALTRNRRETVLAVIFASGYGIFFYIPLVYLPTYASEVGGIGNDIALQINSLGIALAMPLIPLFGWVSDHLLRRRSLLLAGFVATAVCAWGLVWLASLDIAGLIGSQIALSALVAIPLGAAPAMLVELFPVADRLTGYSLAYNLGLGIAGGTAPMIATWLISVTGLQTAPGDYLALAAVVSAGALWLMQDRSREPLR